MKVLYVTTVSDTLNAFLIPHIRMLKHMGHTVDIACRIVQPLKSELFEISEVIYQIDFQRSIVSKKNLKAYQDIRQILKKRQYDIVHTHTPVASACVRLASRDIVDTHVYYTAHGFHFYEGAPIKNWLIYFPIEYGLSFWTDRLITINQEDYYRANRLLNAAHTYYLPGVGIDVNRFSGAQVDRNNKRQELNLSADAFVLLSIGELNANKNHELILRALKILDNPDIQYVICGIGSLQEKLAEKIDLLGLEHQVQLLGYRTDIHEICQVADVFVFPSYREGLPVSVMEAMATGLPIICSRIRGNMDLVTDGYNGYLHAPIDAEGFARSVQHLFENREEVEQLGKHSSERLKIFSTEHILRELRQIYS